MSFRSPPPHKSSRGSNYKRNDGKRGGKPNKYVRALDQDAPPADPPINYKEPSFWRGYFKKPDKL